MLILTIKDLPKLTPHKRLKLTITYSNNFCSYCLHTLNIKTVEDTTHIFTHYSMHTNIDNKVYKNIINTIYINTKQNVKINFISSWFTNFKTECNYNDITKKLCFFPKDLRNMGYIPKNLKTWIKVESPVNVLVDDIDG